MINEKQSNTLYVIKAFAVVSVILAHMPFGDEHVLSENIRIALGQIGVVVFFLVSGFFYSRKEGDSKTFWIKKLKSIVVPWFIISSVTYALSCILNNKVVLSPVAAIKWILGIHNWYWYMPVLLIMYVVFRFVKKDVFLYLCVIISTVSVLISAFGLINYNGYFTQYFNIFNWIGFFALGIIIRKKNAFDKMIGYVPMIISLSILIISVAFSARLGLHKSYVNYFSLPCELSGFLFLMNVSFYLNKIKVLNDIGKKSFFIYLIQMQIAGIINTRLPYNILFFILRPFIVLTLIYVMCLIIEFVLKKTKLNKYGYFIGIR